MNNLFDIRGRVVVVSGACGVIGGTISRYFAEQGCRLVLLGRAHSLEKGERMVSDIEAAGGEAIFLVSDVLDEGLLKDNRSAVLEKFGTVDVLLNCAGGNMSPANVSPEQNIFDLDIEATRKVFDLNIMGAILPTKVFVAPMVEQGSGSIVNFCSMSSFRPLTRVCGYGMAKSALASWTQWLAGEIALKYGDGVRVNAIAPGFILSEQNRSLLTNTDGTLTDRARKIIDHTPYSRFLEPEELCGQLHFFASDASKAVTGVVAAVDGGFNSFSI